MKVTRSKEGFSTGHSPMLGIWQNLGGFRLEGSGSGPPFLLLAPQHTCEWVSPGTGRLVSEFCPRASCQCSQATVNKRLKQCGEIEELGVKMGKGERNPVSG